MEPAEYLDHVRRDGAALAAAARRAPGAAVASCPGWDMSALVGHAGIIHRWVVEIVRTAAVERVGRRAIVDAAPSDPTAVVSWYDEGLASLIETLGNAEPDDAVWNWSDNRPAPTRFWFRRMAHETAVHRWDAEAAAGSASPVATDLAVDGVDEYLDFASSWLPLRPIAGLGGSLHLHATDTGEGAGTGSGEWSLIVAPDRLEHRKVHTRADAAVRGTASDLLLWLLNRKPADQDAGLTVFGDRAVVDAWRQIKF